jgi:multisubunit Na+/H+ antiporter MnhB subunit
MTTLTLHLWIGFAVAALAVLAVWQRTGRRITLYAVTLQILVGIVLVVQGVRGPWYHYALAVLAWAGYMAANALSRRPGGARTAIVVTVVSSLLVLIAFGIGQQAVRGGLGTP